MKPINVVVTFSYSTFNLNNIYAYTSIASTSPTFNYWRFRHLALPSPDAPIIEKNNALCLHRPTPQSCDASTASHVNYAMPSLPNIPP